MFFLYYLRIAKCNVNIYKSLSRCFKKQKEYPNRHLAVYDTLMTGINTAGVFLYMSQKTRIYTNI
jgi:L-rhamnose mutarotase